MDPSFVYPETGIGSAVTSEPARHALYNRLGEVLGNEHAETLMTSLPFQPTTELATKSDLERLEQRTEELRTEMRSEFRDVRQQLTEHQRSYVGITVGAMTALTAIFSVVVGLIT